MVMGAVKRNKTRNGVEVGAGNVMLAWPGRPPGEAGEPGSEGGKRILSRRGLQAPMVIHGTVRKPLWLEWIERPERP